MIRKAKEMIAEKNPGCELCVDGGIRAHNVKELVAESVDVIVASSAIFGHPDGVTAGVHEFRQALDKAAQELIERHGYRIAAIRFIPEGANHFVFDVTLEDSTRLVAKFQKTPGNKAERRDSLFGGLVSLERESAVCRLVREKAALPAPTVYLAHHSKEASFLLVEKLVGVPWREYLQEHDFSRDCFLRSLEYLGQDIARLQQIQFRTFGDVMDENTVQPGHIDNFADRFIGVMNVRIDRALKRDVFTTQEIQAIRRYFVSGFQALSGFLQADNAKPVMVFTDMHADNFLVDETGKPSGYFDLESCQAAHPALEFYGLGFFLFNYLSADLFHQAEASFFAGYERTGGVYDRFSSVNAKLENLLATGRMLELSESYLGVKDGLRNSWSSRFKALLWQAIETDRVDYMAVGDIFREKTRQPKHT